MIPKKYIAVYCTCPDEATAGRIAQALVEERLAACVNSLPGVASTYRWEGSVRNDVETLLIIKSGESCFGDLSRRIAELHPYETPEIIAVPVVMGSERYLEWLGRSLRDEHA